MKKLLFLLTLSILLTSCGGDDYADFFPDDNNKNYPITINAQFPNFDIATTSKAAVAEGSPLMYDLVVYKESGDVYYQWDYLVKDGTDPKNIFSFDGKSVSAKLELPAGKYYIAMLIHKKDARFPNTTITSIVASNYNTDNFGSLFNNHASYPTRHNGGIYFNNAELTVAKSETGQNINMVLEPMWSYVDININDAKTFKVPEGTDAIQFVVNPLYYGFNIKTKLGAYVENEPIIVPLNSIRQNSTYSLRVTTSKAPAINDAINVSVNYLHLENNATYSLLETKKLSMAEVMLENGNYYEVKGDLTTTDPSQSMNISLGSFSKEDVIIELTK